MGFDLNFSKVHRGDETVPDPGLCQSNIVASEREAYTPTVRETIGVRFNSIGLQQERELGALCSAKKPSDLLFRLQTKRIYPVSCFSQSDSADDEVDPLGRNSAAVGEH